MIELNKIYNEDCFEGIKRIPDGSIDMILTDPPYNTTAAKWDTKIDLDLMWKEFLRVAKENAAFVITSQQPFTTDVINANRKYFRYEWIWKKAHSTGFLQARRMPLKAHENVLISRWQN